MKVALLSCVRGFAAEYHLLEKGDKVLVAVSGGPDSMTLLHLLLAMRAEYNLKLVIAHLEHGLRGEESLEQADFVKKQGEELGLKCLVHHENVVQLAKNTKCSLEEAGREARYNFLLKTAQVVGATKIALGHTADDQAETLLMRLLRGAGPDGLAGMRPRREEATPLIRPLLNTFRWEILAFLKERNIQFCVDSTNLKPVCLRNKIRLDLMPWLGKEYNPRIVETLCRTAFIMGEQREWIASLIEEKLSGCLHQNERGEMYLDLGPFASWPIALQKEVLRQAVQRLRPGAYKIDFLKVSLILKWLKVSTAGSSFCPGKNILLQKQQNQLWIKEKPSKGEEPQPGEFFCLMNIPGLTRIPGLNLGLMANILDKSELKDISDPRKAFLDYDTLRFPLFIRNRKPSDRFQPFGLQGTKKLKDFFIDARIPRQNRDLIPLVVSSGEIVWVVGMRIAEPFKITEKTVKILMIEKVN